MSVAQPTAIHTEYKQRIDALLLTHIPEQSPERLHQAMRYVISNGGKRLRPILVYATGHALGADITELDAPACAVELIHTYSLIHDDLPAMDDDDWRRGQPTCHKAFDEATAILAGDGLQALAFSLLAQAGIPGSAGGSPAKQHLRMIAALATAAGVIGMVGGQALDLAATGRPLDLTHLQTIHRLKTGALIQCCIELGLIAANLDQTTNIASPLREFASYLGLAFQIQDDILDVEGDITTLGKPPGSDKRHAKLTYPSIIGLTQAKTELQLLRQKILAILATLAIDTRELAAITQAILK